MNYNHLTNLDESLTPMVKGSGPCEQCIRHIIYPPDVDKKYLGASAKKPFSTLGRSSKKKKTDQKAAETAIVPSESSNSNGNQTAKEILKPKLSCEQCDSDTANVVLHSYTNIHRTTPDSISLSSSPSDNFPDREKVLNNIKTTVERMTNDMHRHDGQNIDPDSENSESSLQDSKQKTILEPDLSDRRSVSDLINAQYEKIEENLYNR